MMALLFADSFDHYPTASIAAKWGSSLGSPVIVPAVGRNGTAGFRAPNNSNAVTYVSRSLPGTYATLVVGFSYNTNAILNTDRSIFSFLEGSGQQTTLRLNQSGSLSVVRGISYETILGTSSAGLIIPSATNYIEFKVTFHNTTGAYEVRINAANVLSATGVNTRNTANNYATGVLLGSDGNLSGFLTYTYDDFYVCDTSGSVNNDFLGDVRIEYLAPTGAGNSTAWSPVGAAANWDCVDETSPDGDTTYVTATGSGTRDLYALADMATNPASIRGIQTVQSARKLSGGSVSTKAVTRIGGTNYAGTAVAQGDSYMYTTEIRETNPNTGTAWTKTTVDAMETGIEIA